MILYLVVFFACVSASIFVGVVSVVVFGVAAEGIVAPGVSADDEVDAACIAAGLSVGFVAGGFGRVHGFSTDDAVGRACVVASLFVGFSADIATFLVIH